MEQNFFEPVQLESNRGVSCKQKFKTVSAQTTVSDSDDGCFDCNICLDSANDPVVTLCGHLYCWPCIYKWLHVQSSSAESDQQQKCPVCKANISSTALVPLYGRGTTDSDSQAKKPQLGLVVPHRPPPGGLNAFISSSTASAIHPRQQLHPNYFQSHSQPFHNQQYFPHLYGNYAANPSSYLGVTTMTSIYSPTISMVGDMIFARIFGTSNTNIFGSGSPRMRRQDLQLEKSLTRVFNFLFCCFILCLLLF
ncbi:E3 ubiquitin-protein ligase rma1h1-like protein [Quillaja saponaria]|uniref:E3 ubiquitin-protein ligase RMA n=1 Tax=Quillaja saponaria TaxID=32244 RepID=A0AAD7PBE4_QUISA|nr:E3 ubiquitin-protein ligase rma1h1-like protein [Quillaja saponaria]